MAFYMRLHHINPPSVPISAKRKQKNNHFSKRSHNVAFLCVETRIANFEFVFASTKYVIDEEARAKLPKNIKKITIKKQNVKEME